MSSPVGEGLEGSVHVTRVPNVLHPCETCESETERAVREQCNLVLQNMPFQSSVFSPFDLFPKIPRISIGVSSLRTDLDGDGGWECALQIQMHASLLFHLLV